VQPIGTILGMSRRSPRHLRSVPRTYSTARAKAPRIKKERSWKEFRAHMREDPKAALEGDLKAVVVGLVIIFFGSMFVAGTFYWTVLNTQPGPAMPILGTVIFFVGGVIMVTGLTMAILCLGVNFWGWLSKEIHHDGASAPAEPN
jgi:hypothetical protein